MQDLKLAILIDADNISPKYVKVILDEAASFGVAACKRIYGDWSDVRLKSWKDALLNNSIIPIQQYSYTTGKNATDSAMIIDAMDLLYSGNLDGFCIVSSDSDFTRLAARLREAGKLVIGMGESKALGPFVKACDQFKYLDLILDHGEADSAPAVPAAEAGARAAAGDDTAINRESIGRIIDGMIDEMDDGTGWVRTSRVGDQLIKRYPDFDVRNFGSKSLNKFLASLPELEVEERILANGNPIQFVHMRPAPAPKKAARKTTTKRRTTGKVNKNKTAGTYSDGCQLLIFVLAPLQEGGFRPRLFYKLCIPYPRTTPGTAPHTNLHQCQTGPGQSRQIPRNPRPRSAKYPHPESHTKPAWPHTQPRSPCRGNTPSWTNRRQCAARLGRTPESGGCHWSKTARRFRHFR